MNPATVEPLPWRALLLPVAAMAAVIVLSNFTVQFPINDWLTWGAFTYPLVFLVCDLTNRAIGPAAARRVAWAGFAVADLVTPFFASAAFFAAAAFLAASAFAASENTTVSRLLEASLVIISFPWFLA